MTGTPSSNEPTNHVLPAWDLLTGMTLTAGITAALLRRAADGVGSRIELALTDVALSAVGSLGWLADADIEGLPRPKDGNYIYGAFGGDFVTSDGGRVEVVALTASQWRALCQTTGTTEVFAALENSLGADFTQDADRYRWRETLASILRPWFASRSLGEVSRLLDAGRVLWGPYHDMAEAARLARKSSPLASEIEHPGIAPSLAVTSPLRWGSMVEAPVPAPKLGAHTTEVLSGVLGLSSGEIGSLDDRGVIGSEPDERVGPN